MVLDSPLRWLKTAVERRALQLATGYFHVRERRWIDQAPLPKHEKRGRSVETMLALRGVQVWVKDEELEKLIREDRKMAYIRWTMEFHDTREKYGRVNLRKIFFWEGLDEKIKHGVRRTAWNYPGFFTVVVNNRRKEDNVMLTDGAKQLLEDERRVRWHCDESACIRILKKLLMMCQDRRFPRKKLKHLQDLFGFPYDFDGGFLRRHPEHVRIVDPGPKSCVELVSWDDSLAVSQRERYVAAKAGGQEHAFEISYPEGYRPNAVRLEELDRFQKLPFASPYEFSSRMFHTAEGQKRVLGVYHELLSMTVEKKADLRDLLTIAKYLNLPRKFSDVVLSCHPGIFYVSGYSVILREAYRGWDLIVKDQHPVADIRKRYRKLMELRPERMHSEEENCRFVPGMERGFLSNRDHLLQEPDSKYFPAQYGLGRKAG